MKNLFKSMMLVAVAAMGFTACSKDTTADVAPEKEPGMVTMTITAEDATRTFLTEGDGVVNFGWNEEGEALRVIEVADATPSTKATDNYTLTEGKAKFSVKFTENTEASSFTYYAVYPNANYISESNRNYEKFKVELPAAQNYVAGSYDPAADLMIAKPINATSQPTELNMQFARLAALAKMTLKGMPEDKNITSLTFTATGKALAGRAYVNLNTAVVEEYGYSGQKEESITLTISEDAAINNDAVYFTCFPVELVAGDTFEVKAVTADKYTYTKSVTLAEGKSLAFTTGNLSTFTVNMSSAEVTTPGKVFTLLTDVSKLNVGDEIIIANKDNNVALSTTQNNNNRGQIKVTIEDDKITAIESVAVLTVGKEGEHFTLYDPNGSKGAGYLYAASNSSNYLRTQDNNDRNGQWKITIENTGVASIVAQGSNSRNTLQYNKNSSIFSCYSSTQQSVCIYLNDINDSDPIVPTITVAETAVTLESTECDGTITITTKNVTGEVTATHGEDYDWFASEINNEGNLYYFAEANTTAESRTATVTLSAEGAADVVITFTQGAQLPGTGEGTLESPYDVTRALAAIDAYGTIDNAYVKGTITQIDQVSTEYGNATYYIDNDLQVYRGLYLERAKFTAEDQIHVGDEVVVCGELKLYGSIYEFNTGSYIVSLNCEHEGGEEPDPTPDPGPGDEPSGNVYTKITSTSELTDGQYLIVYETENCVADGSKAASNKGIGANGSNVSVTITNNTIASSSTVDAAAFTIQKSGTAYTIQNSNNEYINSDSGATGIVAATDNNICNISIKSDGTATIANFDNTTQFVVNTNNGVYFRFYKNSTVSSSTSYKNLTLYKKNN